jgi:hypothetical protein
MPEAAYRAVRSRRKFSQARQIMRLVERGIDTRVKPHFIEEFERRVVNWEHQPDFKARKFLTTDAIKLNVFPAGPHKMLWVWTDKGTKAHKIPKAGPGFLSFKTGYKPKTAPVGKFGGPGIFTGERVTMFGQVDHPGTKAREFTKTIKDDNKTWYRKTMESIWRQAIRAV